MSRYRDPFDAAKKLAGKTDPQVTDYFHSCVIIDKKGRIIGQGVNHWAGNMVTAYDTGLPLQKTVHAEIHALSKVGIRRLAGATIINYMRTNVGTRTSYPCPTCKAVLKKLGIKKLFHSVDSSLDKPIWQEERL